MTINTEELFRRKQELNKFLREHPELQPLQDSIQRVLDGAGSNHNRMVILTSMMRDAVNTLQEKWDEVRRLIGGG